MPDARVRLPRILTRPPARFGMPARVGIVVGLWCVTLALTVLLAPFIQRSAFIFFWLAVLGSAVWAGWWAAFAVAVASVCAVNWLFVPPVGEFRTPGPTELVQLCMFLLVASFVSLLLGRLERARRLLREDAQRQAELNEQLQEFATQLEEQAMELEQQNEELQGLAEEAAAANRAKGDFLATMSHELRTPINAAMGYVDLLDAELHGPVTPAQRDDLARIRRSQRRLLTLVTDVLSFTRLESAKLELHPADVALTTLFAQLEESVEPLALGRGVRWTIVTPEASLVVRADPDRLEQVMLNLLGNAIKFTNPGGEIVLHAEARGDVVAMVVRDTGRGIPADQLERVFEPFVQVEHGLTRTADGTGLGLAISRGLARAMGGDVRAESTIGEGSTFTVTMPMARGVVAGECAPSSSAAGLRDASHA